MDLRDLKEGILDTFKYLIVIVVVFLVVMYVMSLQQVVGSSMSPTLEDKDILLLSKFQYKVFDIKRNDVVVVSSDSKYLVKRIIGLPGEKVEYKDNILYINGETFEESLFTDVITNDFTFDSIASIKESTVGESVIPKDMYLVLGDNRSNSSDSREFGLVDKKDITGKTLVRVWPINKFKIIK